ncbi:MAG TPA: Gfo/Idh/MocA family oxidoreductase [Polyangiaceae bacterium]|nr:Gfo/Idh/MocA family oxidoreductase [Polyangiaceae bacterium]
MTPRLRAAVIGCGRIGTYTLPEVRSALPPGWLPLNHAEAIRSQDDLELVAVCDVVPDHVDRARRIHGVDRGYSDYRTLVDEEHPDVLAIATRTAGRCDIVAYAAERGVRGMHVEKPLGTNLRDVRRALDAVRANGVALTYGTTRRFMEAYREARAIVQRGDIGTPEQIIVQHGRGLLLWSHPHSADLLVFFAGEASVAGVQAQCTIAQADPGGLHVDEDPFVESAFVRFASGMTGLITSGGGNDTLVSGTHGTVTVAADGAWIETRRRERDDDAYPTRWSRSTPRIAQSGTQRAFAELAAAVGGARAPSISLAEIEASQQIVLLAAWSSLHEGRMVTPAELPLDFTVAGAFRGRYA